MKRLRELRKAKGISQQALAEVLEVTQQSIYKYENGLATPDLKTMIACANYFHTSIDYLVGNTDVPARYDAVQAGGITLEEQKVLDYYRNLTPKMKALLDEAVLEAEK